MEIQKDIETAISLFKPPIFWKDKDLIKQQLKVWSLPQLKVLIKNISGLELLIKKNSKISNEIISNFILERLEIPNN